MSAQGMAVSNKTRRVLAAGTLTGDRVTNRANEDLGKIEEIMIDLSSGSVAYAVLSFGGFLGLGDKLFAVPWQSFELDMDRHEFILDVDKTTLENAPGFDKDNWPDFADETFGSQIHSHYGQAPYWERNQSSSNYGAGASGWGGTRTTSSDTDADVARERVNQPDLPEGIRRRPTDLSNFPGSEPDADLRSADPSRTYGVIDTSNPTRKS